jgi:hypothetical protein
MSLRIVGVAGLLLGGGLGVLDLEAGAGFGGAALKTDPNQEQERRGAETPRCGGSKVHKIDSPRGRG